MGGQISGLRQGPYAPMGSGIDIGEPLDMTRRRINNADGSFSTERTMTFPIDGRWYNVPSIVNGLQMSPDQVEEAFRAGLIPSVGNYPTLDQAERSAIVRSQYIGRIRGDR